MKEGNVTLNTKEQRRLMILNQLGSGSLASQEGAGLLGISERQLRRLRRAYQERGAAALAHGNRGRSPVNVVTASVRQQVVMLATTRYHGFNHQHLDRNAGRAGADRALATNCPSHPQGSG